MSLGFRPLTEEPYERLREVGYVHGPGGGYIAHGRGPGDERVLAWPQHNLVAVEGRMGAMLSGDPADHDLVSSRRFGESERAAEDVLEAVLGYRPCGQTIVETRRYDLAGELNFERGDDGLAFLRTMGAMCPSRMRLTQERGVDGQVQTVYVRTPRAGVIQQRFYDKGVESGSHPAGQRVRIESQLRPVKAKRLSPGAVGRSDLRSDFIRRMEPYVTQNEGLVAAGSTAAADELLGRVARDELSMAKAERMLGSLVVLERHGRGIYSTQQGQRRLRALRTSGVALEHELPEDRVVPVGQLLRDLVADFAP